ncbi:MAG: SOS response-associated peptidase [Zoogloeaceae bacterium]|nr:SOS response-associated peptidase [Zoogloeaceae bacterium]
MCGRFALKAPPAEIMRVFGVTAVPELAPRYNIAPTQDILIVRQHPGELEARREAVLVKWGLLPSWAKDTSMAAKLANARGETVAEKPAFRNAFRRMRCLVPADGFYEWEATPSGKQPWFLRLKSQAPLAFAGLWEHWQGPDGAALETATLITTDANELVRPVHDRMPVILQPGDWAAWLGAQTKADDLKALLKPLPADLMERYLVSRRMSNARNEGEECIRPVGID